MESIQQQLRPTIIEGFMQQKILIPVFFDSYSVKAVTAGNDIQLETIITGLSKLTEQDKFNFIDQLAELYNNKTIHGNIYIAYQMNDQLNNPDVNWSILI
eukprot:TRINITY_DN13711_c0_g1_i1.p4 TRINITY_DN13711_c0_g1~~TRINITY_DN13711_c0_g1_i1.p4  ORF type:complete len:100 (+),score=4.31 TRINITY_DN13711_c0_g1_i1:219-518(+)